MDLFIRDGLRRTLTKSFAPVAQKKDPHQIVSLYFSESMANNFGSAIISVPDGQGSRMQLNVTRVTTDEEIGSFDANISDGKGGITPRRAHVVIQGTPISGSAKGQDEQRLGQCRWGDIEMVGFLDPVRDFLSDAGAIISPKDNKDNTI